MPLKPIPCVDDDGQAENCSHNALYVHDNVLKHGHAVALPLKLDNATLFHISFLPLLAAMPKNVAYQDGSGKGIQMNIDRLSSYALPIGAKFSDWENLSDKLDVGKQDAKFLYQFINTALTGEDYFKKSTSDLMHKIMGRPNSKKDFIEMLNEPDFEEDIVREKEGRKSLMDKIQGK